MRRSMDCSFHLKELSGDFIMMFYSSNNFHTNTKEKKYFQTNNNTLLLNRGFTVSLTCQLHVHPYRFHVEVFS